MKKRLIGVILLVFPVFVIAQEWTIRTIGTCSKDKAYSVSVGNGRNDGINRVYVSTRGETTDGAIYEFTYAGGSWSLSSTIATSLNKLVTIDIGAGRNDNINRVYAVEFSAATSRVIEYTWNGTSWTQSIVQTTGKGMLSCEVNDARGDGVKRLYVGGWIIHREYTWTGSSWSAIDISTTFGSEGPVAFGKGKNDNIIRYYAPGNRIKEFTWNGSSYSLTDSISTTNGFPETVVVGDFRNDQNFRVMTQDNFGTWEYSYNSNTWSAVKISGRAGRSFLLSGITKSDGKTYVYSTDIGSPFREYSFNSTTQKYDSVNVDALTGATALLDIGEGRNDDTIRIYTTNYATGAVYEVTNIHPYVNIHMGTSKLPNSPKQITVINDQTARCITINSLLNSYIECQLYDINGKVILKRRIEGAQLKISHSGLNSGIYILKVNSGNQTVTEKLFIGKN